MITELEVTNYRSLKKVRLSTLGRVNILVGPGNSGKTNLLEALVLACSTGDPSLLHKTLGLRRIESDALTPDDVIRLMDYSWTIGSAKREFRLKIRWNGQYRSITYRREDAGHDIPLKTQQSLGGDDKGDAALANAQAVYRVVTEVDAETHRGTLIVTPNKIAVRRETESPNLSARFIAPALRGVSADLAPLWTKVEERGFGEEVLDLVRLLDRDIEAIRVASNEQGQAYVYLHHSRLGRLPLEIVGAGLAKAMAIASYVVSGKDSVLIVDEIDASLHFGAQRMLVTFLMEAARKHNVQLIVSTHSLETFDVFLESFKSTSELWSKPSDLMVLQLRRDRDETSVRAYDANEACRLRDTLGVDLRR